MALAGLKSPCLTVNVCSDFRALDSAPPIKVAWCDLCLVESTTAVAYRTKMIPSVAAEGNILIRASIETIAGQEGD